MVAPTTKIRIFSNSPQATVDDLYTRSSAIAVTVDPVDRTVHLRSVALIRKAYVEELYQLTLLSGHHIITDDRTLILTSTGWKKPSKFRNMKGRNYSRVVNKRPQLVFFDGRKFIYAYLSSVERHFDDFVYELETEDCKSCFLANGFVVKFGE